jgi:hypothetical protein
MTSVRSDIAMSGASLRGSEKSKKAWPRAARSLGHGLFGRGDNVAWWTVDPRRIDEVAHAYRVDGTAELESFGERRWQSMLRDQSIAEDGRLRERGKRGEGIVP